MNAISSTCLETFGKISLTQVPLFPCRENLKGDFISGPTLFRPSLVWHSDAPFNWGHFGGPNIDKALDAVRFSGSDTDYRAAVASLNQIVADDPPAVFLAWQERARAVSRRFSVPSEPGRDILGTLRLWKPAADTRQASRN